MVVPLNDLDEQRGPVLHGFAEDLEQIALVIKVHKNLEFLKLWGKDNE